jgi:cob(I)alamin adenosyltransferase
MVSNADALKKKIDELKKQLATHKDAPKGEPKSRALRKELKRSQKILDLIGKELGEITKGAKKTVGNPYVHSLRKKTKSYNKRIKKTNRLLAKKKKDAGPAAAESKPAESAPPPTA